MLCARKTAGMTLIRAKGERVTTAAGMKARIAAPVRMA